MNQSEDLDKLLEIAEWFAKRDWSALLANYRTVPIFAEKSAQLGEVIEKLKTSGE